MPLELRAWWREVADKVKRRASRRLSAGRGVGGRSLRRKERPDGKRLGGTRLPGLLRRGTVAVRRDGFSIRFHELVGLFHRGSRRRGRVPRPIVGITRKERAEIIAETRREAVKQINRDLQRG